MNRRVRRMRSCGLRLRFLLFGSWRSLFCSVVVSFLLNASAPGTRVLDHQKVMLGKAATRPVTVADSIGMKTLADSNYFVGYSVVDPVVHFSPDGTKFVVVLRKGNLQQNTNEYSLFLW